MTNLLLFIGENVKFDKQRVKQMLSEIPGTYGFREEHLVGSVMECEYQYEDDRTIVRLTDDLETISIAGLGDASLQAALEIQKRMAQPLRAVDWDYSFDLDVSKFDSLDDLREAVSDE